MVARGPQCKSSTAPIGLAARRCQVAAHFRWSRIAAGKRIVHDHFENGPSSPRKINIEKYEPLATFETEMRKNDAPPGIMKARPQSRGRFGKVASSASAPPGENAGPRSILQSAVRWAARANVSERTIVIFFRLQVVFQCPVAISNAEESRPRLRWSRNNMRCLLIVVRKAVHKVRMKNDRFHARP